MGTPENRNPEGHQLPDADAILAVYQHTNPDILRREGLPLSAEEIGSLPVAEVMHPATAFLVAVLAKARHEVDVAQWWVNNTEPGHEKRSSELRLSGAQKAYAAVLSDFEAMVIYPTREDPGP